MWLAVFLFPFSVRSDLWLPWFFGFFCHLPFAFCLLPLFDTCCICDPLGFFSCCCDRPFSATLPFSSLPLLRLNCRPWGEEERNKKQKLKRREKQMPSLDTDVYHKYCRLGSFHSAFFSSLSPLRIFFDAPDIFLILLASPFSLFLLINSWFHFLALFRS